MKLMWQQALIIWNLDIRHQSEFTSVTAYGIGHVGESIVCRARLDDVGQWVSFPKCRSSLTRSHHMEASAI